MGVMETTKLDRTSGEEVVYYYHAEWSQEDKVHVGRVAEFPSLAAHGDSPQAARAEIMAVVRCCACRHARDG